MGGRWTSGDSTRLGFFGPWGLSLSLGLGWGGRRGEVGEGGGGGECEVRVGSKAKRGEVR
jgi:hypothetical protein